MEEKITEKQSIKFYLVRVSPPCRIVWLYMLQQNIPHILIDVDLASDTSDLPDAVKELPHLEVPIIVDGDYIVFEAPAIIEHLARTYTGHVGFGQGQPTRALVESLVSWANGELHRCVGYNYVYPQFLDRYALPDKRANEILIDSGLRSVSVHLEKLETRYLKQSTYLCGHRPTIADAFVCTVLLQLEWTAFSFKLWPKLNLWLSRVKHIDFWDTVHEAHGEFVSELRQARTRYE